MNKMRALAIAKLQPQQIAAEQVRAEASWVMQEFDDVDGDDRTAKDKTFTERLANNWKAPTKVSMPAKK